MSVKLSFLLPLLMVPVGTFGAATQALVTYLDLPDGAQSSLLAADKSGNLFVISTVTQLSGRQVQRITKTNRQGTTLATMDFGPSQKDTINAAAVDPNGDLVLAGTTQDNPPEDFPLVSPLISDIPGIAAFIVKIDSQLQNILFSTLLGGAQGAGTVAEALAIDGNGNIYVTGSTVDASFPVTPGAF
jgi:Beta-propeller repeat